jgi:hypothetical protein
MIRYHGTPITPQEAALEVFKRGHAMVSFANRQQEHLAFEKAQGVALDNGAFTFWKTGERVDVPSYIGWVQQWMRHPAFEWCLIPDVIDGTEEENASLIFEWPLSVMVSVPVWHMHESIDKLDGLVGSFPRVAIGSSGDYAQIGTAAWWNRMAEAMAVACDEAGMPRTKLHGLRQMDPEVFSVVPYHSVDSTNVARNVGIDSRWTGRYVPPSKDVRALCIRDIVNNHASAWRWNRAGVQRNLELLG